MKLSSLIIWKYHQQQQKIHEVNRKSGENGRQSAMFIIVITCHHCKKAGQEIRKCKILTRELEIER